MKKRKITITVCDEISDLTAINLVKSVINQGKISHNSKGDFYCWAAIFSVSEDDIAVYTSSRSKSPNVAFEVRKL